MPESVLRKVAKLLQFEKHGFHLMKSVVIIEAHNHVENAQELHFCLGTAALKHRSKIGEKGKTKRKALCLAPISTSIRQAGSPCILLEINTPALSWSAHVFRLSFFLLKSSQETLSAWEMSGIYYCDTSHSPQSVWQNTRENDSRDQDQSWSSFTAPKAGATPTETKNIFGLKSAVIDCHTDLFWGIKKPHCLFWERNKRANQNSQTRAVHDFTTI